LTAILLLNLLVAVVLNVYNDLFAKPPEKVDVSMIDSFVSAWSKQDPDKSYFIPIPTLPALLRDIEPPLGKSMLKCVLL
jgi:hypothetical protein